MKRVLIVEDDKMIAELERDYLEANSYDVDICYNGTDGLNMALAEPFDVIILDIMLPDSDGFMICRQIRQEKNIPIIFVTAKQEDIDIIRGLGLGADDYMVKPFNPSELVARVKAHTSIHNRLIKDAKRESETPEIIESGDIKIIAPYHKVIVRGKEIELRNKEFELLYHLASHPQIVFSKETLFEKIWGWDSGSESATVIVHINRLREKIEKDSSNPEYIQTVWGVGYRFAKIPPKSL